MAQSGEISPGQVSIASIDELITAAKQDRVDKAIIQSDPKGERNGMSFRERFKTQLLRLMKTSTKHSLFCCQRQSDRVGV